MLRGDIIQHPSPLHPSHPSENAHSSSQTNTQLTSPTLVIQSCPRDLQNGLQHIVNSCPFRNLVWNNNSRDPRNVSENGNGTQNTTDSGTQNDSNNSNSDSMIWFLNFTQDLTLPDRSYTMRPTTTTTTEISNSITITISYKRKIEAFRALGRLFSVCTIIWDHPQQHQQHQKDIIPLLTHSEQARFETLGVMMDCSRGAVLKPDTVRFLLRQCSLLGLNTLQLYTEDTYTVRDEPFFGYFRGKYSDKEIREMDEYAFELGIEVFPCIQTLGHLGQILQWPRFANVRDTSEVILSNSEETYTLLRKMLASASTPYRSTRIHIGMDEAHGLGEGRYKQLNPLSSEKSQIFLKHLQRVYALCRELNLSPLIWSDMLFSLSAKNFSLSSYYDFDNEGIDLHAILMNMDQESGRELTNDGDDIVMTRMNRGDSLEREREREPDSKEPPTTQPTPSPIQLVYWDYYHTDPTVYSRKIQHHRQLGVEPWVAGGIWTWNRLYTALPFTFEASKACLTACIEQGVKNVFVTIWGDDGNECDSLTCLPGLAFYGEYGYLDLSKTTNSIEIDMNSLKRRFWGCCGGNFDDFVYASHIDIPPYSSIPHDTKTHFPPNMSKWLLWQDPLYGVFDPQIRGYGLERHYHQLHTHLHTVSTNPTYLTKYPFNTRLLFPSLISKILSTKTHLRSTIQHSYTSLLTSPKRSQQTQISSLLQSLLDDIKQLWKLHRDTIWRKSYKPFGSEIIELRYGGLMTRTQTFIDIWTAFINNEIERIEELEVENETVWEGVGPALVVDFCRAYTPSRGMGTG